MSQKPPPTDSKNRFDSYVYWACGYRHSKMVGIKHDRLTIMTKEKPTPPGDYECCESGCSPCVWDLYYEELNAWNAEQKAAKEAEKEAVQKTADTDTQE